MSSFCALQLPSRGERSSHLARCFDCSSHHCVPRIGAGGLARQNPSDATVIWSRKLTQGNQCRDSFSGLRSKSCLPPQKWGVVVGSLPLPSRCVGNYLGLAVFCVKVFVCGFCSRREATLRHPQSAGWMQWDARNPSAPAKPNSSIDFDSSRTSDFIP